MAKGKYQEWLTDEGLLLINGWAKDGLTDKQIAKNIGVSEQTLNVWKKKHPSLSESLKSGKEVVDREVENALLKRALGYNYIETTKERLESADAQRSRHDDEGNAYIELTTNEWEAAIQSFDNACAFCGSDDKELTKDHLLPLSKGGHMSKENIIPACRPCNSSKKDHDWEDWFPKQDFYSSERYNRIKTYINVMRAVVDNESSDSDSILAVTKEVTKHVQPDTTAQIFWLKNRKPEIWRDKQDIQHSGGMNVNNSFSDLTTEELRKLANKDE